MTFRFDNGYDFDYEYDLLVRPKSCRSSQIVVGLNLVSVFLHVFTTRIAEDFVINITSLKAKKSMNAF